MRIQGALLGLCLAGALPAASVSMGAASGASGSPSVVQVPALRVGEDSVLERTNNQYRASYYYALALLAAMADQHDSAALALERAQAADPESKLLRRELAGELEASGQDAKAAVLYRACLDDEPTDLELRRHLSRLYLRLNRGPEARALFLNRDGSEPTDLAWLRSLVGLDLLQEDLPGAEARLRTLLGRSADPDDRELLALTLQREERWKDAAEEFRVLLRADGSRAEGWARLAACDEAGGDTLAARGDLDAGIKALPENDLLRESLAKLLYRVGDFNGAEDAFTQLLQKDPLDSANLLNRGLARLKAKHYAQAEEDFTELGKLKQDEPGQPYALALAQIMQKKYAPAEQSLKKALELKPDDETAWVQMAFLYDRQKRPQDAIQALTQGLQKLPKSEELALLLAAAQEDAGRLKEAAAVLRRSLGQGAGAEVRFQLAVLLDKQGAFDKAQTELLALIAQDPKHAQALNYLGYSWADRGIKLAQAEDLIRRALAQEPDNRYYMDSLGWDLFKQAKVQAALDPLLKASAGLQDSSDADEAVVFDHLAQVQAALGHATEADQARGRAQAIRDRSKLKTPAGDDDRADQEPAP